MAAALAVATSSHATDAPPADAPQQVLVTAHEQPLEEKPYRDLLAAMSRFERYRGEHPDAQLRFRIYPRKDGVDITQLRAWIRDPEDASRVELTVAADGGFTVPVLAAQREHAAVVRTNMPEGTLAWTVEVKRSGDDGRHRRMGDLREACFLDVDFAHLARVIKPPMIHAIDALSDNICLVHGVDWGFYADKPVFSVHLDNGDRHVALLSDRLHTGHALPAFYPLVDWGYALRDRLYSPPLNDASWPDDTTVSVIYADDPDDAIAAPAAAPLNTAESAKP